MYNRSIYERKGRLGGLHKVVKIRDCDHYRIHRQILLNDRLILILAPIVEHFHFLALRGSIRAI